MSTVKYLVTAGPLVGTFVTIPEVKPWQSVALRDGGESRFEVRNYAIAGELVSCLVASGQRVPAVGTVRPLYLKATECEQAESPQPQTTCDKTDPEAKEETDEIVETKTFVMRGKSYPSKEAALRALGISRLAFLLGECYDSGREFDHDAFIERIEKDPNEIVRMIGLISGTPCVVVPKCIAESVGRRAWSMSAGGHGDTHETERKHLEKQLTDPLA